MSQAIHEVVLEVEDYPLVENTFLTVFRTIRDEVEAGEHEGIDVYEPEYDRDTHTHTLRTTSEGVRVTRDALYECFRDELDKDTKHLRDGHVLQERSRADAMFIDEVVKQTEYPSG